MKKIFAALLLISTLSFKAQYGTINAILDRLEEKKGISKNVSNVILDDIKFVFINDFDDHTERNFIIIKDNLATYVEVFDDKKTGETSSNVFSGDIVRSKNQIISLRADELEGKKLPLPITKTFLMSVQKKILYLVDINTKERWIEESALSNK